MIELTYEKKKIKNKKAGLGHKNPQSLASSEKATKQKKKKKKQEEDQNTWTLLRGRRGRRAGGRRRQAGMWSSMKFNERELGFFGQACDESIDKEGYLLMKEKVGCTWIQKRR